MKDKNIPNIALSERLTQLLKARKITKAELARRVGTTPQAVNNWFKRDEISLSNAQKIAESLNISLDWLLSGAPGELLLLDEVRKKRLRAHFTNGYPEGEAELFAKILSDDSPFPERLARRIEEDYNIPHGYLDFDPDGPGKDPLETLSEEEKHVISMFRQIPESERKELVFTLQTKVDKYKSLFKELLAMREKK